MKLELLCWECQCSLVLITINVKVICCQRKSIPNLPLNSTNVNKICAIEILLFISFIAVKDMCKYQDTILYWKITFLPNIGIQSETGKLYQILLRTFVDPSWNINNNRLSCTLSKFWQLIFFFNERTLGTLLRQFSLRLTTGWTKYSQSFENESYQQRWSYVLIPPTHLCLNYPGLLMCCGIFLVAVFGRIIKLSVPKIPYS